MSNCVFIYFVLIINQKLHFHAIFILVSGVLVESGSKSQIERNRFITETNILKLQEQRQFFNKVSWYISNWFLKCWNNYAWHKREKHLFIFTPGGTQLTENCFVKKRQIDISFLENLFLLMESRGGFVSKLKK